MADAFQEEDKKEKILKILEVVESIVVPTAFAVFAIIYWICGFYIYLY